MSELLGMDFAGSMNNLDRGKMAERKEIVKNMILKLHEGEDPRRIKEEFLDVMNGMNPLEIALIEEELIRDGMPREEVYKLCDLHLEVFKESLNNEEISVPEWHPISILMREHIIFVDMVNEIRNTIKKIRIEKDTETEYSRLSELMKKLKETETHYIREENVLFPYLEKHGVTQPPAIMWMEHDKIRNMKKNIQKLYDSRKENKEKFLENMENFSTALIELLSSHYYKENKILFPTALKVITEDEWIDVREEFDEIGYCCLNVKSAPKMKKKFENSGSKKSVDDRIKFKVGELKIEELEALLNTVPFDITFVDKDDAVRYFNQTRDRVFQRTKAIIGRKVQQCHPQKSVHIVNKILEDFKNGKRNSAEFWINFNGRFIYIRYFAVRDRDGKYLGTIEITQDITDIKKLEGEKRLLDD